MFFYACAAVVICGCSGNNKYEMGTYGYDLAFFAQHNVKTVELKSADGQSKVMVIPAYQGRVMTSTTGGDKGNSYGWINYKFIEAGKVNPQFNPDGGEERFWIGPEGGPNSYYFKKGIEQVYENWRVPAAIDTMTYDIQSQNDSSVCFTKQFSLVNASDHVFSFGVKRTVSLLSQDEIGKLLQAVIPADVKTIAFRTDNVISNQGDTAWTKESGLPSVWLLGTFNPTPTTTVFIPYNKDHQGKIVNDEYFGKVPSDRLIVKDGVIYFKIDGKYRSKIGLPEGSAKDLCGSFDSQKNVLTILKYTVPAEKADYVNGKWGAQDDPFSGDVINSYNDGPTETGYVQGPFYEIETSSPGAALGPGQSLTHTQYTMHFEGSKEALSKIVSTVFGVNLDTVAEMFR
jgi:hypothetical protein